MTGVLDRRAELIAELEKTGVPSAGVTTSMRSQGRITRALWFAGVAEHAEIPRIGASHRKPLAEVDGASVQTFTRPGEQRFEGKGVGSLQTRRLRRAPHPERSLMMLTAAEIALDDLAKKRAAKTGETYATAYDMVVRENPHLYQRHDETLRRMGSAKVLEELNKVAARSAPQTTKSGAVQTAEKAIEEAARTVRKRDGVSYHAAYDMALREQPDLYERYLAAQAS